MTSFYNESTIFDNDIDYSELKYTEHDPEVIKSNNLVKNYKYFKNSETKFDKKLTEKISWGLGYTERCINKTSKIINDPKNFFKIDNILDFNKNKYDSNFDDMILSYYKDKLILVFVAKIVRKGEFYDKNNNLYLGDWDRKKRKHSDEITFNLPVFQIWNSNYELEFEKTCNEFSNYDSHVGNFKCHTFHLNNLIILAYSSIIKFNVANHEILIKELEYANGIGYPNSWHCLATQNKTNQLYIASDGIINVYNIKTLNLLKRLLFYDGKNHDGTYYPFHGTDYHIPNEFYSMKIIWDTLYFYIYEDFEGGSDKLAVVKNINDTENLSFDLYELYPESFLISNHIEKYENYIYISGEESAGIHIFDTQKNTLVNFDPAFGTDWRNYKSYINICENYLINVNYYLGREENPTVIEIVNLEKNKSIEEIDYRIEFKDPYRIKNVNIRQNIAYFYCLNLQNQNIEILTYDMTNI